MFAIAAIISFALSVIFYAWTLSHGVWSWELFMLIGLLCLAISGKSPKG
jgi:hypothetical protein